MQSKTVGQVQWELLKGAKHWHRVPKQTWDPNGDFTMQVWFSLLTVYLLFLT